MFPWPSLPSRGYVYISLPTFASVVAAATRENLAHVLLKPSSFDSEKKNWQVASIPRSPLPLLFLFNSLFTTFPWNTRRHSWGATRAQAWLIRVGNPLKYKGTEPSYVPRQCEPCVCIFNLDPLVCAQSISPSFIWSLMRLLPQFKEKRILSSIIIATTGLVYQHHY